MPRWVQCSAAAGLRCVELQHVQFDQRRHGNRGPGGLRPLAAPKVGDPCPHGVDSSLFADALVLGGRQHFFDECVALLRRQLTQNAQQFGKPFLLSRALLAQSQDRIGHRWAGRQKIGWGHLQGLGQLEEGFQADRHALGFIPRDSGRRRVLVHPHPHSDFALAQAPQDAGLAQTRGHHGSGSGRGGGHGLNGCNAGMRTG